MLSMVLLSFSSALAASNTVNLGTAGDYTILSKAGISTVPNSVVTGNIGVSPIDSSAITGFSLTADATDVFSTSTQITGKAYASNYTSPTPSNLTTAVSNMETAYTDAAGRAADYTELYSGDLSGQTLVPGVYKWSNDVLINSNVTLNGGANDVFIFQIAGGITQANGTKIILSGGAQADNVFWQSAKTVAIGTNAHFEGIILGKTNITLGTKASINGRLFAQTAVTLDQSTVTAPVVTAPVVTAPVVTPPVVTPPVETPPIVIPPIVETPPVIIPPVVVTPPVIVAPVGTPPVVTAPVAAPVVVTPPVVVTETVMGGQLPNTSTPIYEMLLIGAALMLLGAVGWRSRKRFV